MIDLYYLIGIDFQHFQAFVFWGRCLRFYGDMLRQLYETFKGGLSEHNEHLDNELEAKGDFLSLEILGLSTDKAEGRILIQLTS